MDTIHEKLAQELTPELEAAGWIIVRDPDNDYNYVYVNLVDETFETDYPTIDAAYNPRGEAEIVYTDRFKSYYEPAIDRLMRGTQVLPDVAIRRGLDKLISNIRRNNNISRFFNNNESLLLPDTQRLSTRSELIDVYKSIVNILSQHEQFVSQHFGILNSLNNQWKNRKQNNTILIDTDENDEVIQPVEVDAVESTGTTGDDIIDVEPEKKPDDSDDIIDVVGHHGRHITEVPDERGFVPDYAPVLIPEETADEP